MHQNSQLAIWQNKEFSESSNSAYVMLANFADETLTILKVTVLGVAEEVS